MAFLLGLRSRFATLGCAIVLLAIGWSAGCNEAPPTKPRGNIFLVQACTDTFRVRIDDPAVAAEADSLAGRGHVKILSGIVRAGDGGFNAPWPWHLDPDSIEFAEVTIELCDGCPEGQESNVGNRFCPWSTQVIRRD